MAATPDGRERLLKAAIRHLERHSEADLRITEIASEADVAIGLIRHHFGDRDGLVAAAQEQRIAGATRNDLRDIRSMLQDVATTDDLLDGLERITAGLLEHRRRDVRLSRLAAIGVAHGRPEAREHIGATLGGLRASLQELIEQAQERGLLRGDLDAAAMATFIQAYAFGLIVHDLDPDGADHEALLTVIRAALTGLVGGDD